MLLSYRLPSTHADGEPDIRVRHRGLGRHFRGQIVTLQKFVKGEPPSQEEVDAFLLSSGIEPVKQNRWLWRRRDPEGQVDYWIGDARADNFVKTPTGIVPIDIRMWGEDLASMHSNW